MGILELLRAPRIINALLSTLILLAGFIPAAAPSHAYSIKDESVEDDAACLSCHSASNRYMNRFPAAKRARLQVREEELIPSVHSKKTCVECHKGMNTLPHRKPYRKVSCSDCHFLPETLGAETLKKVKPYGESVHHVVRSGGNDKAPTCTTCHGVHDVLPPKSPASRVNRANLPKTCGTCHVGIFAVYVKSVHGRDWKSGNTDTAICTDCHGEHNILRPEQAKASVGRKNIPATCSVCHASEKLDRRYKIGARRSASYNDSFHGIALQYGDVTVANCASCHGYHDILPSSDPDSPVHSKNIAKMCGRCHPGAGENFAKGTIHLDPTPTKDPFVYFIRLFYTLIIGSMILGFAGMIALDLYRRRKRGEAPLRGKLREGGRTFERLTVNERLQHAVLVASFTILVLTGLPLFFYHFKLFHSLIPGETLFQLRGLMHRVAAVALGALCVWHALYLLLTRRGRREFVEFLPRWKDLTDFFQLLKYSVGFSDEGPRFGRYNIFHKFEYWAVVWGSCVMIGTGFLLWFEVESMVYLPKWILDIARVVHGYEATLAYLSIIIWHFYNVHLNPDVFPLSKLWLTGKLTEAEMKQYHPLEYEEIIEKEHASK